MASAVSCENRCWKKEKVYSVRGGAEHAVLGKWDFFFFFRERAASRRSGHVIELDMKFKCRSGIRGKNRRSVLRCLACCIPCHLWKTKEIGSLESEGTVKICRGKFIKKKLPLKYPVYFREIISF